MPFADGQSSMTGMRIDAKSQPMPRGALCTSCPRCARPVRPDEQVCAGCGVWLTGPQAAELWWIEGELGRVDQARIRLEDRRKVLLVELARMAQQQFAPEPAQPKAGWWDRTGTHNASAKSPARPELSGRSVAHMLLAAGAALVAIAAIAFAVANWSTVGPLGRCGILLGVTALVLGAPVPLSRRAMNATAESIAATGLALTIADTYLALRLVGDPAGNLFVLAATCAALATAWAAYGLASHLRIPRLAAIAAAQLPGLLAIAGLVRALGGTAPALAGPIALALALTSAADLLLSRWIGRTAYRADALASSIAATVTWAAAVLLALHDAEVMPAMPGGLWISGTLLLAGAIGIGLLSGDTVAWLPTPPIAALAGALLAIGFALPAAGVLPADWDVASFAAAGALVAGAALVRVRESRQRGDGAEPGCDEQSDATAAGQPMRLVALGSAAVLGGAGLIEVPAAVAAMFPLRELTAVWSGASPTSGAALAAGNLRLPGAPAAPVVLALVSLACWLAPPSQQLRLRAVAVAFAGLAAGSVPVAARLTGWAPLAVLTAGAAIMLGAGAGLAGRLPRGRDSASPMVASAATCCGVALAVSGVLWSLTAPAATIAELAVLTVLFCLAAARARTGRVAQLMTGCALAAATGLACTLPLASGWPARHAAFAVLGVAVVAAGIATVLCEVRPAHALVLDLGAGLLVPLAAAMAAEQADTFAVLATVAAIIASSAAWLRSGRRRVTALCAAACTATAAVAIQGRSLMLALLWPYGQLARSWHGYAQVTLNSAHSPGLALAVIVLGACAAAMVTAAGAWRGSRGSLDAAAAALPLLVAPAALAGGLRYLLVTGLLLALALVLTAWSSVSRSLAPAAAALVSASLALAWALIAPAPTLIALGCLTVAYPLCTWRSRLASVRVASACLSVLSAAALAGCAARVAGWHGWQAGLVVIGVGALAQAAAVRLAFARPGSTWIEEPCSAGALRAGPGHARALAVSRAIEVTGWLTIVAGMGQCLSRSGPASLALAVAGLICVGVAARADRHPVLGVGLALCEAAWCVCLAAAGVSAPEPYTVPAAAALIGYGLYQARRNPLPSSWLTYGPGLALLLVPSLAEVWQSHGWIRPLLLGLAAVGVTLSGARVRLQAPLLIGAAVAALDAGHALAPAILRLASALPSWLPIAVTGAILLWSGATYEARLRNLSRLRNSVAAMR
jgi:hypothetical protein